MPAIRNMSEIIIICAQCEKPVDKVEVMFRPEDMTYVFAVDCHGAKDQCKIDSFTVVDSNITHGVAFATPALEGPDLNDQSHPKVSLPRV